MDLSPYLNQHGLPLGVSFARATGTRPHCLRVTGPDGVQNMFSLERDALDPRAVYAQAIGQRLAWLGVCDRAVLVALEATFDAFCAHYGLRWEPRTVYTLVVDAAASKAKPAASPWTEDEDAILRDLYGVDSSADLGMLLGRGAGAVRMRAKKLGLKGR